MLNPPTSLRSYMSPSCLCLPGWWGLLFINTALHLCPPSHCYSQAFMFCSCSSHDLTVSKASHAPCSVRHSSEDETTHTHTHRGCNRNGLVLLVTIDRLNTSVDHVVLFGSAWFTCVASCSCSTKHPQKHYYWSGCFQQNCLKSHEQVGASYQYCEGLYHNH